MATKDPAENEDDENPAFLSYLEKNLPWLTEKLKPSLSLDAPKPGQDNPITKFFQDALTETKAALSATAEQLEAAKELLTPEQLIQFKSRKSGGGGDPGNPPKKENNGNDPPPPKEGDPPPAKKKSRWL
jgi:hypothetical protein